MSQEFAGRADSSPPYESLPRTIRRIVRDELRPLIELTQELTKRLTPEAGGPQPRHENSESNHEEVPCEAT
jgi:hypothetical protein